MLATSTEIMLQHVAFYYNLFDLYQMNIVEPFGVAIVGKSFKKKRLDLSKSFLPATLILGGASEGNLELLKGKLGGFGFYIFFISWPERNLILLPFLIFICFFLRISLP